jgi:quercetin dioxygenase-like cupin family protein
MEGKSPDSTSGKLPPAEPVRLAEIVQAAPGSVVSRTLIKNPSGTVTLFSFDRGQGLSEHTAPFDALVHILDGKAELTIGGKRISAETGDAVLMPADVPHSLHAADRFKMLLVMIRG